MNKILYLLIFAFTAFGCVDQDFSERRSGVGEISDGGYHDCTSPPLKVMFVGNSITRANSTPSKDGFRGAIQGMMVSEGISFTIVGQLIGEGFLPYPYNKHEGHGSFQFLPSVGSEEYDFLNPTTGAPQWLSENDPDLVVILSVGTVDNAMGRPLVSLTPKVRQFLELFSDSGRRKIVLGMDLPQGPPSGGSDLVVRNYNSALVTIVNDMNSLYGNHIALANTHDGFDLQSWSLDGVHVTDDRGSAWIAYRLIGPMKTLLY